MAGRGIIEVVCTMGGIAIVLGDPFILLPLCAQNVVASLHFAEPLAEADDLVHFLGGDFLRQTDLHTHVDLMT